MYCVVWPASTDEIKRTTNQELRVETEELAFLVSTVRHFEVIQSKVIRIFPDKMSVEASGAAAVKNGEDVKGDSSLNLFRIPHTRMKELVSWPLKGVQDLDVQDLEPSLQVTRVVYCQTILYHPFLMVIRPVTDSVQAD